MYAIETKQLDYAPRLVNWFCMNEVARNLFRLRPMERRLLLGFISLLLLWCLWQAIPHGERADKPPSEKRSLQVP